MPNIFTEFTEKVRAANPIQDVLPELLPDFKGFDQDGASRLKCLCPFEKGDDTSFLVYLDDQSYRCLRCDCRGDVFDLVQGVTGVDFIEAATILAERAGIEIPQAANADLQFDSKKRQIQDILMAAADLYWLNHMLLPGMSPQKQAETVKRAREQEHQTKYGWAENVNLAQYLAAKGFDMELAKKAGVVTREGTDLFHDREIRPVWARGRVVYMIGEARQQINWPKYLDLPVNEFVKSVPFEDDPAGTWGKLLIALSPEEATTLQGWGYDVLHAAEDDLSGQELQLLAGHEAIYVSCGGDRGRDAPRLAFQIAQKTGVMPYLVRLSERRGANEFAAQGHSRYDYGERLKQADTALDATLGAIQRFHGPDRTRFVAQLFDLLAKLSELDIPTYRKKVVKALGITSREFDAHLKSARTKPETSAGVAAEDIDEGSCLVIHPALDYLEQIGVVTVALDVIIDDRVVTRPYLITSDRQRLEPDGAVLQVGGQRVLFRSEPKAPCEVRWRKADIDRFLARDDPDPAQTFSRLLDIIKRHIDFRDPVEAEILAIWCMASYICSPCSPATPICTSTGSRARARPRP